jgi:hypothetical protein
VPVAELVVEIVAAIGGAAAPDATGS